MHYCFVNYANLHQRSNSNSHRPQRKHNRISITKIACISSTGVLFSASTISAIATVQSIAFATPFDGLSVATTNNISIKTLLPLCYAATFTVSCKYASNFMEASIAIRLSFL